MATELDQLRQEAEQLKNQIRVSAIMHLLCIRCIVAVLLHCQLDFLDASSWIET